MNTPLAQAAEAKTLEFKEHASPNQLKRMLNTISEFDTDLSGCGFFAIQAKVKLQAITQLTETEFKAICELLKK